MGTTKKILCPVDFSSASEHALGDALALAKALGAEVHLLHVYQMPQFQPPIGLGQASVLPGGVADAVAGIQRELRERIETLRGRLAEGGVPVHARISEGHPAVVAVAIAEQEGFDMIALGTRGLSGLRHLLLGSVAERIVRTSTCPVLTFPPPEG